MKTVVFAGTFDPFTAGHLEITEKAALLFDKVVVAVAEKSKSGVSAGKRAEIARLSVSDIKNASVEIFDGFLTDYMKNNGYVALIRGIRNVGDFDYEKNLKAVYEDMYPEISIAYIFSSAEKEHISSSLVREILSLYGDASAYISDKATAEIEKEYMRSVGNRTVM